MDVCVCIVCEVVSLWEYRLSPWDFLSARHLPSVPTVRCRLNDTMRLPFLSISKNFGFEHSCGQYCVCVCVCVGVCILQQSGNGLVLHSAARGLPVASCPVSIIAVSVGHYTCCQVTLSLSLSLYVSHRLSHFPAEEVKLVINRLIQNEFIERLLLLFSSFSH